MAIKFTETPLTGAYVVELQPFMDDRGFFARAWCQREFEDHGLAGKVCQVNYSANPKKGTFRGFHYQVPPYAETKLIRCIRGALFDVIIDLRAESATFGQWFGIELSARNYQALYCPERFAHGFITLENNTDAFYQVSEFFTPGSEHGIRFDDPKFNVKLPIEPSLISDKDRSWAEFEDEDALKELP